MSKYDTLLEKINDHLGTRYTYTSNELHLFESYLSRSLNAYIDYEDAHEFRKVAMELEFLNKLDDEHEYAKVLYARGVTLLYCLFLKEIS